MLYSSFTKPVSRTVSRDSRARKGAPRAFQQRDLTGQTEKKDEKTVKNGSQSLTINRLRLRSSMDPEPFPEQFHGTLAITMDVQPTMAVMVRNKRILGHAEEVLQRATLSSTGQFVCVCDDFDEGWHIWDVVDEHVYSSSAVHDGTGECICPTTRTTRRALEQTCPVQSHTTAVTAVAFSPCVQLVASGDDSGKAMLWDTASGRGLHVLQHHTGGEDDKISSVSFTSDGSQLVTACYDMSFCVWETVTGAQRWKVPNAHGSSLVCVDCSPTNAATFISTGSGELDGVDLKAWDIQTRQQVGAFPGAVFGIYSPDGQSLATVGGDGNTCVFILDSTNWGTRLALQPDSVGCYVTCGCFSPDGKHFAMGTGSGDVYLWELRDEAHVFHVVDLGTGGLTKTLSLSWERDRVHDTNTAMAFAMGHHLRLGAGSLVHGLDSGVNSKP